MRGVAFAGSVKLGLGLAALGRPAYMTLGHAQDFAAGRTRDAMRAQAHAVLDAAFAAGVRYFDCARSYGDAEAFVRSWLNARRLAPSSVTVGSKWGYVYEGDWRLDAPRHERKEHSLAMFEHQVVESTALLGGYLRLYQIHSATLETGVLENAPILDALARLKDRPMVIGLTTTGPAQADTLRRAMGIVRDGAPLFGAVQATWNLLERSCEAALVEAKQAGMTVVLKEVLANGRLTARGDAGARGELAVLARERGTTPDALALAAALRRPWVDRALSGASTVEQLASNARALELELSPADEARLESLREAPRDYWEKRGLLAWN